MQKKVRLIRLSFAAIGLASLFLTLSMGCSRLTSPATSVFLLVDARVAAVAGPNTVASVVNRLLANLAPGDTLAVARIDAGRFDKRNIIAKATFGRRPSVIMAQKRIFQKRITDMTTQTDTDRQTDITGGLLLAVQSLNQTQTNRKFILMISDLNEATPKQSLKKGYFRLDGIHVIVPDLAGQAETIQEPDLYQYRMNNWRTCTEASGGIWQVIGGFDQLDPIFEI